MQRGAAGSNSLSTRTNSWSRRRNSSRPTKSFWRSRRRRKRGRLLWPRKAVEEAMLLKEHTMAVKEAASKA